MAISAIGNVVISEDAVAGPIAFSVTGFQTRTPTVSAVSDNATLVGKGGISLSGVGGSWSITVTPTANQTGTANITVTATDGFSTDTELFSVTVRAVNDPPTVTDIGNQTINEDAVGGPWAFTIDDVDTAVSTLTVTTSVSNTDLIPTTGVVVGGTGSSRTLTVTPRANISGSAVIGIFVSDGSLSASTRFVLTVLPVNDAPTVSAIADQVISEDTSLGPISFTISDPDTSVSSLSVTASSSNQSLVSNNGIVLGIGATSPALRTITVTPLPNQTGTTTLSVNVSDGVSTSTETFLLTVSPVNDAPTISDIGDLVLAEDTPSGAVPFTIGDIDNDPAALTLRGSSSNSKIIPDSNIVFGGSGANRTVTVTPATDVSGPVTITVTVSDGSASASDSFSIRITPVNDAPQLTDVADRVISEDTSTGAIAFTIGDVDSDIGALTVQASSGNTTLVPAGNVVLGGSGANRTVTVTPVANLTGSATITLTVSDGVASSSDQFVVRVDPVNDGPTITSIRSQSIPEDSSTGPLSFSVGDIDNDPAALVVQAASSDTTLLPAGNIVLAGSGASRTVTVSPAPDRSGSVLVTLTVSDGSATASMEFNVTVSPVNDAPTISDLPNRTINESSSTGPLAFSVADVDHDVATLTVQATSGNASLVSANGLVVGGSGASRTLTVTPIPGQSGSAVITVTVSDGTASSSDQFTLTVSPVNDPPTISDIADQGLVEDSSTGPVAFTVGDSDNDVATLTVQASSGNTGLVPNANLILGGSGANRTITVTPASNQSGTAVITVTVSDGNASASDQFTVTVRAANDPPTISDVANQTIPEDGSTGALSFTVGDPDNEAATLVVQASSGNTTLVPAGNVVVGGSGANRTVTVTPAANQTGTAQITITVSDGSASASDQFTVTVNAVNDPPTISDIANQSTSEGTPTGAIAFSVGDVDNDPATLTVQATSGNTTLVPNGNLVLGGSGANRTLTLTPAANQSGSAVITVTVSDGSGSASDQFTLTVGAVNDPPTISDISHQTIDEDGSTGAIPFTIGDPDNDLGSLTVRVASGNTTLVPSANLVLGGSGANRTLSIRPAPNQTGSAVITVTLSDGIASVSDQFTLTVNPVNDPPTVSDIANQSIDEDQTTGPIAFTVGDADHDASVLVVQATSGNTALVPNSGLVVGGSGSGRTITVTPAANQFGSAVITVSVSDGIASATDQFTVTVNPVNDPPTISDIADQSVQGGGTTGRISVVVSDPDTPASQLVLTATSSNTGLVPLSAIVFGGEGVSRNVTVTPVGNSTGSATIRVTVSDGELQASDSFVVSVTASIEAPKVVSPPSPAVVLEGETATFTVGVAGTSPFNFQWLFNETEIKGATEQTLVLRGVTLGQAGSYRVKVSNSAGSTTSAAASLTVQQLDFGDAPESSLAVLYHTRIASKGPRHRIVQGFFLGKGVDGEPDGQPSVDALGDDNAPTTFDDEDGVQFASAFVPGQSATLIVTASTQGILDAWFDFNRTGGFENSEHAINRFQLAPGPNTIVVNVPTGAVAGDTFARFRLSRNGVETPDDLGSPTAIPDGEVEDYRINVGTAVEEIDFGDAPEGAAGTVAVGYPTTLSRNGARHVIVKGYFLGKGVDAEANGQPSADGLGDDGTPQSFDDEDGVEFAGSLVAGQSTKVTVTASAAGRLDAWVDFDQDRSWADAGEQVFVSVPLAAGANSLSFPVPASAKAGATFARFRFSKEGKQSFVGQARDGEVEDYRVVVESDAPCDTDYLGTEFWLAFPGNYVPSSANQLRLTLCVMGPVGSTGTVAVPGLRYSKDFTIPASRSVEVTLPDAATLGDDVDVVRNRGIKVTANAEVAVFGLSRIPFSADGFLGLPVDVLGREYLVVGYPNEFTGVSALNGTQFAVVATEDETEVTIIPSRSVLGHPKGEPFVVQLKEGQAYQLRDPDDADADLTGTQIFSNKPVGVFGGHQCANVNSPSKMYCDYMVEQLLPVHGWARTYYLAPLATRTGGDTVRIVAAHDNTTVVVGAQNLGTIDRGQVITYSLTQAARIDASRPVHITQVANSSDHDGVKNADPFMIAVPPSRFGTNQHWVCAGPQVFGSHYIQVIGPAAIGGSLTLDGAVVPLGAFSPIGATGFSFARLAVAPGPHLLAANTAFTSMVYGWGLYESYGWPGGMRFGDLTPPTIVCPPDFQVSIGGLEPTTGAPRCTASVPDLSKLVTVEDNCGFPTQRAINQDPQPGTQLGPGVWPITISVIDASQNEASCTVMMTVVDDSKPSITCPKDFTVLCNKGAGARVAYQVIARTPCGRAVPVECSPAPGALFLPGTTVVECHVKDAPEVRCSFRVTVVCPPPGNRTDTIKPQVPTLQWSGGEELETSFSLEGPWTPVPAAVSPFTPALIGDQQFFRVRRVDAQLSQPALKVQYTAEDR